MTTLEGRPNTALIVIDAQRSILAAAADREGVVANIGGLLGKARAGGVPVIWIQHSDDGLPLGSAGWQRPPTWRRSSRGAGSGASSSPAPRPTRASGRRSTAPSPAGTT